MVLDSSYIYPSSSNINVTSNPTTLENIFHFVDRFAPLMTSQYYMFLTQIKRLISAPLKRGETLNEYEKNQHYIALILL
jgi:hypothetical protein